MLRIRTLGPILAGRRRAFTQATPHPKEEYKTWEEYLRMCSTSTIGQRVNEVSMRSSEAERVGGGRGVQLPTKQVDLPNCYQHTQPSLTEKKRSNIFSVVIYLIYRAKQTKQRCFLSLSYTVKKAFRYSCPQPGCHLPNYPWAGIMTSYINYSRLGRVWYRK
jgi:hypothetical protein